MIISRSSDYGIRALIYLAKMPVGESVPLKEISEKMFIPGALLSKLLQKFRKLGVVRSFRGKTGGFALAKPASSLTLLSVIEMIDGPISVSECQDHMDYCGLMDNCFLYHVFGEMKTRIVELLVGVTVQDCTGPIRSRFLEGESVEQVGTLPGDSCSKCNM